MTQQRRFTKEFQEEAVRLVQTSGRTQREIAGDLGIGQSTLVRWLGQNRDRRAVEPSGAQNDVAAERVHWMRNALAHVQKGQHTMVAAAIRQAFLQTDADAAHQTWRHVADQLRPRWPKLAALMDDSEHDVLAYMTFPNQHRTKLHSTNPLERLNKEVKRRADVVGIFPNEASITRLIGAVLLEQNDEWLLQCRYMQIEGMAELTPSLIDADPAKLPPMAGLTNGHLKLHPDLHHLDGRDQKLPDEAITPDRHEQRA